MVGIIMISHGSLAEGMLSAATMLYPDLSGVATLGLQPDENPDSFQRSLTELAAVVDSGDGLFILADLLGGTPCNRAMHLIGERVKLLSGLSLPMLLALLGIRDTITDMDEAVDYILDKVKTATLCVNDVMK